MAISHPDQSSFHPGDHYPNTVTPLEYSAFSYFRPYSNIPGVRSLLNAFHSVETVPLEVMIETQRHFGQFSEEVQSLVMPLVHNCYNILKSSGYVGTKGDMAGDATARVQQAIEGTVGQILPGTEFQEMFRMILVTLNNPSACSYMGIA